MAFDPSLTQSLSGMEESHWFYKGRRILLDTVLDISRCQTNGITLDIGCSTGSNLALLGKRSSVVVGYDLSLFALASICNRDGTERCQGDVVHLPFLDGCMDLVVGLDVIEHLQYDALGAAEIARVLKPGGHAVLFAPAYPWLWSRMDEVALHYRRYTARSLRSLLEREGLVIVKLSYWNTVLLPILIAYRKIQPLLPQTSTVHGLYELSMPPDRLNQLLVRLLAVEAGIVRRAALPCGGTVVAVAQKPRDA
jgi:SAM-dependent methyltransferase